MNSGTDNRRLALKIAKRLANGTGDPHAVHGNRFDSSGNLWITQLPHGMERAKGRWAKEQEARGATVVWPTGKESSLQPASVRVKAPPVR